VDIDRFLAVNSTTWNRLTELCGRRRLDTAEVEELVRLYQRASSHLSYAQTYYADPALIARLTTLVGRAHAVVYGTRRRSVRAVGDFFVTTFPGAVWESRVFVAASAAVFFLPAIAVGVWLAHSPRAIDAIAPSALRQAYINHDFAAYYRSQPSAQFAAQVQTNNIRVAFEAFAAGIAGCVVTAVLLAYNGMQIGAAGGLFAAAGKQAQFWGLVLPHGLLEITSIIIAGGAGLRLGWAVLAPGDMTRRDALAAAGRRAVTIVMGLILTFIVAGLIEGFVTGSSLHTTVRVGIGVLVETTFLVYIVALGPGATASRSP
jgi:uncharacterized membrane protein SpoIIM required for sporulation